MIDGCRFALLRANGHEVFDIVAPAEAGAQALERFSGPGFRRDDERGGRPTVWDHGSIRTIPRMLLEPLRVTPTTRIFPSG